MRDEEKSLDAFDGGTAAAAALVARPRPGALKIGLLANLEARSPCPARMAIAAPNGAQGKERHGRRREDRVRQGLVRRHARQGGRDDAQGRRAGQGPGHDRAAVGDEGIARQDYAKTKPDITFIDGSSGAQATTLADPRRTSIASTAKARSGWSASASMRSRRATRRCSSSPRTTASRTRRCRASWRATAPRAARSSTRPGCRSAPRTTPR